MKQIIVLLILFLSLSSWKADKSGPWVITKGKRIILYSRPLGYSKAESPDSIKIQAIIQEQEYVIDYINKRLHTDLVLCRF